MVRRPSLLVLVRHAESVRNIAKKDATYLADEETRRPIRGIPDHDVSITDSGLVIAEQTGVYLRKTFGQFDYAYHSGYLRTQQTLDALLSAYTPEEKEATQVRMNSFIRERDPGYTYDMTQAEAEQYFPYLEEYWQTFGGYFSRPPGGESLADVSNRIYTFLNMIYRDRVGEKVLVVTHGETLRSFRFLLERWDYQQAVDWPEGQEPKNCGITYYESDQDSEHMRLAGYNLMYDDQ